MSTDERRAWCETRSMCSLPWSHPCLSAVSAAPMPSTPPTAALSVPAPLGRECCLDVNIALAMPAEQRPSLHPLASLVSGQRLPSPSEPTTRRPRSLFLWQRPRPLIFTAQVSGKPPALPPRRPSAAPSPAASAGGGGGGGGRGGEKEAGAAGEIYLLERELEGLRRRAVELKKVGWWWPLTDSSCHD